MRILFVSNYYPPSYIGGYELLCARAAEFLAERGHVVSVLTSDFGSENNTQTTEGNPGKVRVRRELKLRYWRDVTDAGYWRREWRDVRIFRRHLREFRPDIIGLWNMHKLAYGIVMEAQRLSQQQYADGIAKQKPVLIYHLMDDWILQFRDWNGLPQFWAKPARGAIGKCLKPLVRSLYRSVMGNDLLDWKPMNAVVVSNALRKRVEDAHLGFQNLFLGPSTYDPSQFFPAEKIKAEAGPVRFLWSGRICAEKGFLTTLKALDLLVECSANFRISFCGNTGKELEDEFQHLITGKRWSHLARYWGNLPHKQMPEVYRSHDVFLFTSEVHEGLPSSIVEAFGSGLAIIGTLTGGTTDLLFDGKNCLTYDTGNAAALAQAMERLISDRKLLSDLSSGVSDFARRNYSNEVVFSAMEDFYGKLTSKEASDRNSVT